MSLNPYASDQHQEQHLLETNFKKNIQKEEQLKLQEIRELNVNQDNRNSNG